MSLASVLLSFLLQFLRVNKKEYLKVEKVLKNLQNYFIFDCKILKFACQKSDKSIFLGTLV